MTVVSDHGWLFCPDGLPTAELPKHLTASKLLIGEPGSDPVPAESSLHDQAIPVCRITWAEAMAGMARRQREDPISRDDIKQARQRLIHRWDQFKIVEVSQRPMNSTRARKNH